MICSQNSFSLVRIVTKNVMSLAVVVGCLSSLGCSPEVAADDWPMWRSDAGHTAAVDGSLPDKLVPSWVRTYSPRIQVWDDPLNHDLMQYDRIFEPVVKDGRMFVNFNDADKIVALDTKTGKELWTFYTDGPVRFPAVAWQDCVLFVSDDGFLYAVHAEDGSLKWKFQGAPSSQKAIGNMRMISAWPARGGPVVEDGTVYFSASIWPFMGTFLYALDADSGEVQWVNDSTSAQYIKQPHSAPSFAGVAPQGTMTIVGDRLIVPGGRSIPASFDRHSGEFQYFDINSGGKGNGGSFVVGLGNEYYVHTRERGVRSFNAADGVKTAFMINEPVLTGSKIYSAEMTEPAKGSKEKPQPVIKAYNSDKSLSWKLVGVDGRGDLIKVGKYLYAAGGGKLTAVKIYGSWFAGKVAWTVDIPEDVVRLIAADNQLFAVTLDGQILAFAGPETASPKHWKAETAPLPQDDAADQLPATLANFIDSDLGYALWFGLDDEAPLRSFINQTKLQIVVVDEDRDAVDRFRRTVDAAGEYGRRITAHVGSISTFQAPPYVCRLVVLSPHVASQAAQNPEQLAEAYRSVRPYGGNLVAMTASENESSTMARHVQSAELEKARVAANGQLCVVTREGALPGAANWTHQYGDIANTVKSDDSRVKLPLGVLWFGGSSNLDVLPRHGHGPPEQIVDGRLFIEGMTSLSCRDVYTGQILWQRTFENLGTYDIYFDDTYADTPLDPAYNQVHIPGANGRGTNFVATHDLVYIVEGDACNVLDAKTGETVKVISLPADVPKENRQWAYIGVYNDILLAGAGFANYRERHSISFDEVDKLLSGNSKGFGSKSMDVSASMGLIAFDRHTGEQLWKTDARHSFLHNGIVAGDGRIYCMDKLPGPVEDKLRRRGISAPDTYRILALDATSGEPIWEVDESIFGTWLGYSEEYSLLLQAGAAASDRMKTEVGQGMAVYEGATGQERWRVDNREYSGPCILHGDTILTNANSYQLSSGAFSLLDGRPKLIMNPLTGVEQPWQISRAYGCNSIIASENMLTFRSGAAGYYDLETMSGTGNLGGFKSGCTSNLVVANGLLNAPDYTRTCSCSYQNQTSLALVHMPQMDMWSVNNTATLTKPGQRIRRLGINFGAPGDRTDSTGTLWLDYPPIGGESAQVEIDFSNEPIYQHQHTLKFSGDALPWVAASSAQGLDELVIPLKFKTPTSEDGLVFSVKSANDDVEEQPDGSINVSSSDLEMVKDSEDQTVGIRFADISIARSEKIRHAYIQFTAKDAADEATSLQVGLQDSGNAAEFGSSTHNVTSRTLLADPVAWTPAAWKNAGDVTEAQRTPDLTKLIRQIVNRSDWQKGNALAFVISGSGKRNAKAFVSDAQDAPRLIIEPFDRPEANKANKLAHTIRLTFAELDADVQPGQRIFSVAMNGQVVEEDLDVVAAAGGTRLGIVREYANVRLDDELRIRFIPKRGQPICSGIEVILED